MDDVLAHLGAITRTVALRTHEGKPARVVQATRTYETDPTDLWDAVTNPERIPRWFMPVSGELRLGGRYSLQGNASGTVLACEPPRTFALTWEFGGETTWVTVRLTPAGKDRTTLHLEHLAYDDPERWGEYGPGAVGVGWDLSLYGLALHVATGAQVDHAAAEAWLVSDEGKGFVRGSSDGWGRAAVAAGDNEAEAKASAARTFAFYTGGT